NNFAPFMEGLLDAVQVHDLTLSMSDRKIWAATHGKGAWCRDMIPISITGVEETIDQIIDWNCVINYEMQLEVTIPSGNSISYKLNLLDVHGKTLFSKKSNEHVELFDLSSKSNGIYFVTLERNNFRQTKKMVLIKR
ncbi:MAG TPA: T9SS type A sorting domain-containing protein, partial [Bacteroidia bacterium]|nr:T9SS type A sorting domain-containing protein [Bacteroidia bacterium]